MLDVHILKVAHEREEEARKLLPYILKCDVYSPESAASTEQFVDERETEWMGLLQKPNRTAFHNSYDISFIKGMHPEAAAFNICRGDYLYRNKKPIFFAERCSPTDEAVTLALFDDWKKSQALSLSRLALLDFEGFFESLWAAGKEYKKIVFRRDQIIAARLPSIEQELRQSYKKLAGKEIINYTIDLGAMHFPERYTDFPVHSHLLVSPENANYRVYVEANEDTKEGFRKDMLEIAVAHLSEQVKNPISEKVARGMSFDQLIDWVKSNFAKNK